MALRRTGFLAFGYLIEPLELVNAGLVQGMDLVRVLLHPFFGLVIFKVFSVRVSVFIGFLFRLFRIHSIEYLIRFVELVLLFDYVAFIDVGCFEFR